MEVGSRRKKSEVVREKLGGGYLHLATEIVDLLPLDNRSKWKNGERERNGRGRNVPRLFFFDFIINFSTRKIIREFFYSCIVRVVFIVVRGGKKKNGNGIRLLVELLRFTYRIGRDEVFN